MEVLISSRKMLICFVTADLNDRIMVGSELGTGLPNCFVGARRAVPSLYFRFNSELWAQRAVPLRAKG